MSATSLPLRVVAGSVSGPHRGVSSHWIAWALACLAVLAFSLATARPGWSQDAAKKKAAAAKKTDVGKKKPKDEEEELPAPKDLYGNDLLTKDGVALFAKYYPGTQGRETVPVILLHMRKNRGIGTWADYRELAEFLQKQGHAVLVPDLRGHGKSTKIRYTDGTESMLDASKMPADQYGRMVTYDMETLVAFLRQKNNAEELNLEKLCVVGAEMGAGIAMNFAQADWSWPQYNTLKQGQHVKALVLLSPRWMMPGLSINGPLNCEAVVTKLSILIAVGAGLSKEREPGTGRPAAESGSHSAGASKEWSDVQRILRFFTPHHPEPSAEDAATKKDLFVYRFETAVQGTDLLNTPNLRHPRSQRRLDSLIAEFIDLRLVRQDYPYMKQKSSHGK